MECAPLFALSDRVPLLSDLDGMAPVLRALPRAQWRRHRDVWARSRRFAREQIWPIALSHERAMHDDPWYVDPEFLARVGRAGLLSVGCFTSLGGEGLGSTAIGLMLEELCAGCAGLGNLVGAHQLGMLGVLFTRNLALSRRIQREVTRGARAGRPVLLAAAVTEPAAGSDVEGPRYMKTARIGCSARRVSGGYHLSGTKVFISNGTCARYVAVGAALDRRRPLETWSMFLVDVKSAGFEVSRVEDKMGMKASPAAELHLDEVFVPDAQVISDRAGDGIAGTEVVLGASRGPVGAIATGIARGALERFLLFASDTSHGGRSRLSGDDVQESVAQVLEEIHACRAAYLSGALAFDRLGYGALAGSPALELYRLPGAAIATGLFSRSTGPRAWLARKLDGRFAGERSGPVLAAASAAKGLCSATALKIVSRLMDLMGPAALEPEWGLEKAYRDVKLTEIYEGTNQLNRLCVYEKGVSL